MVDRRQRLDAAADAYLAARQARHRRRPWLGDGRRVLVRARLGYHHRRRRQRLRPARGAPRVEHDLPLRRARRLEGGASLRAHRRSHGRRRSPAAGSRQRGRAARRAHGPGARAGRAHRPRARALGAPQQGHHLLRIAGHGARRGDADERPAVGAGPRIVQRPARRADADMLDGGLKAFLEARDGAFRPEPFGPRAAPRKP